MIYYIEGFQFIALCQENNIFERNNGSFSRDATAISKWSPRLFYQTSHPGNELYFYANNVICFL